MNDGVDVHDKMSI